MAVPSHRPSIRRSHPELDSEDLKVPNPLIVGLGVPGAAPSEF